MIPHETGGTTGTPVCIFYDTKTANARAASMRRWEIFAGMNSPYEKLFYMGRPSFELINNKTLWGNRGEKFYGSYSSISRRGFLASTNLSNEIMHKYCNLIEKCKPSFLKGYASGLYLLAEYCLRNNRKFDFIKAVLTSSDMLSPKQRHITELAWNCPIYDRYGMGEEVATAVECHLHNGYHIDMVKCLIEVIDQNGDHLTNQTGDIIGTNLTNYAMPLIRYRVGDIGSLTHSYCQCGRQSYMLAKIEGRKSDSIQTPDGFSASASALSVIVIGIDSIIEIQFVQQVNNLIVKIVRDINYNSNDEMLLLTRLNKLLSNKLNIMIKYVNQIDREPNGKYRFIIADQNK